MANFQDYGRTALASATMILLLAAAAIVWIGTRSYRAAHQMLDPLAASHLLDHPADTGVTDLQAVRFVSKGGARLSAWYLPPRNRAAVVVTHGTNADRSTMLPEIKLLADAGFGVLAFDWPGLGQSSGEIRWDEGATQALTAAVDWLASRAEIDATRIGGLGFSMGGFIMARAGGTEPRLRALVLEGTPNGFDDYLQLHNGRWGVLSLWPARWALRRSGLLTRASDPELAIGAIAPRAVLLIGGTRDKEVPEKMVRQLYAAAGQPKSIWIVPGADHGGYANSAPLEYPRRIVGFFNDTLLR